MVTRGVLLKVQNLARGVAENISQTHRETDRSYLWEFNLNFIFIADEAPRLLVSVFKEE